MQRVAHHARLLVDLLEHEVREVALADQRPGCRGQAHRALDDGTAHVVDHGAGGRDLDPVALVEIANAVGQGRQRQRVGAQEHLAVAVAECQRAAVASADHQIVAAGEQDGERERADQAMQRTVHRFLGRHAFGEVVADQMDDDLGIGLGLEHAALLRQLAAQFVEVLDDAVVDQRDAGIGVRVGIDLGRRAVGGPPRVANADPPFGRIGLQHVFEVDQLARRAAANDAAVL